MRLLCSVGFVISVALGLSGVAAPRPALFALDGVFRQETVYTYTVTAAPTSPGPVTITLPIMADRSVLGHAQTIISCEITGTPRPDRHWDEDDAFGSRWAHMAWNRASGEVAAVREVHAIQETHYSPVITTSAYPVIRAGLPRAVARWLEPTSAIQSTDPQIRKRAADLVSGAKTELEAAMRIVAWVRTNVSYACSKEICDPVLRVDALFTLEKLVGNCVNFANLSLALLRAAGIPAMSVTGFVADRLEARAVHAWIAVYFPDLGWVELESSNWMPASGEVPVTFLLPQHLTLFYGDGQGVSHTPFDEDHHVQFTVVERPQEVTEVQAEVRRGEAVAWVVTLRSSFSEPRLFTLTLEGIPPGWHASVSETAIAIDPDGVTRTRDVLLTVCPSDGTPQGTQATVILTACTAGETVGQLKATVTVLGR